MATRKAAIFIAALMTVGATGVGAQSSPSNGIPAVPIDDVEGAIQSANDQGGARNREADPSQSDSSDGSSQNSAAANDGQPSSERPANENGGSNEPSMMAEMQAQSEEMAEDQVSIPVTPGVNEIVPIAQNHLNRVLVPFPDPQVRTTSSADYQIHDQAIYVTSSQSGPITMYVTNGSDESTAISLTLVPRRIAPVEVSVNLEDQTAPMTYGSSEEAGQWETSQPYVETIRDVLREVAMGEVPQGYSLASTSASTTFRGCSQPGIFFDFSEGQVLSGKNLRVHIGVATNGASQPIELIESNCNQRDVAAVAAWPDVRLMPDQSTEIYVVKRQVSQSEQESSTARPRLIQE